jgi:NitT/TauT family transport system substrate-binding protein
MKKRVVAVMLIAVMTTLLAVGCGEKNSNQKEENSTKTEDTQKELEKITVTEPVRGILWAPVYAAKELGYFEEEGLDVDITAIKSDTPSAPVMAGEAQIGLWGPEMVCKLVQDGQDIQLFYTCTDKYPYSFFLAKDIVQPYNMHLQNAVLSQDFRLYNSFLHNKYTFHMSLNR